MRLVFSQPNIILKQRLSATDFGPETDDRAIGVDSYPANTSISSALDSSYTNLLHDRNPLRLGCIAQADGCPGRSLIITPERGIQPVRNIDILPEHFNKVLQSRINNHHYRTELTKLDSLPATVRDDLADIIKHTKLWSNWCLFPKYEIENQQYPGAEFGFVAKRTDAGTLITSRASNKEEPSENDYALITRIEDGTINTTSTGRKASLNAPLAHYIFENRPEIKYIVHSHIFLPEGANATAISTPSTQEDWQSIESLVKSGAKIINQPMHGTLILLEKPEELLDILKRNSLYNHNSELYDQAY